jgi:hypothetical protein
MYVYLFVYCPFQKPNDSSQYAFISSSSLLLNSFYSWNGIHLSNFNMTLVFSLFWNTAAFACILFCWLMINKFPMICIQNIVIPQCNVILSRKVVSYFVSIPSCQPSSHHIYEYRRLHHACTYTTWKFTWSW